MQHVPTFGLVSVPRPYVCTLCGAKQTITTNHTAECFAHCGDCSWKSLGFGEGVRMFGTIHRRFAFDASPVTVESDKV